MGLIIKNKTKYVGGSNSDKHDVIYEWDGTTENQRFLNYNDVWHPVYSLQEYEKIEIQLVVQMQVVTISILTDRIGTINSNGETIYSFGFNTFNHGDSKLRIWTGYLRFAGRYIVNPVLWCSYNLGAPTQISLNEVPVTKVIGYHH